MKCAECDCVVDRGLRVAVCVNGRACCCGDIPRAAPVAGGA